MTHRDPVIAARDAARSGNRVALAKIVDTGPTKEAPRLLEMLLEEVLDTHPDRQAGKSEDTAQNLIEPLIEKGVQVSGAHLRLATELGWAGIVGTLVRHLTSQKGVRAAARAILDTQSKEPRGAGRVGEPSALTLAAEAGDASSLETMARVVQQAGYNLDNQGLINILVHKDFVEPKTTERLRCLDLLLAGGADVDEPNAQGDTPLHLVRSLDMANALLAAGANPRADNHRKNKPLFTLWVRRSSMEGHEAIAIAQSLITAGAKWTDGPPMDILNQQMGIHILTEWIAKGRIRGALQTHVQATPETTPRAAGRRF